MHSSLQLRSAQHLTMTPQLQRAIQLLQLSSLEFAQEVEQALASNPLLETVDGEDEGAQATPSAPETPDLQETPDRLTLDGVGGLDRPWAEMAVEGRSSGNDGDDEWDPVLQVPEATTLRDHLLAQAVCLTLDARDALLLRMLIDAVDGSGYLSAEPAELSALLPPAQRPDDDEWRIALAHLQAMDPVGIGARNVAECLTLQLRATPDDTPGRATAFAIVERHLALFAGHDFLRLTRELGCTDRELSDATILIRGLSPRPGARYAGEAAQFVVPDIVVERVRRRWVATINPHAVPRIRINRVYAGILQASREAGGTPVGQQLQEARWLLRNIEQRFATIQKVAQAIVDRQSLFFDYGDVAMRPLTLREIADEVGLHESTVSRVTSRKYLSSPRGVFEFKRFFGSHVETAEGAACSATAVRALIRQLIQAEEPSRPLSDIKVTRMLEQRGIKVARRTVAKYRDLLQIPPVEIRRLSNRQPHV